MRREGGYQVSERRLLFIRCPRNRQANLSWF